MGVRKCGLFYVFSKLRKILSGELNAIPDVASIQFNLLMMSM